MLDWDRSAGGEDVREAVGVLQTVPSLVWIICGLILFYALLLLFNFRFFEWLKRKDQDMRDFSPKAPGKRAKMR